MYGYMTTIGRKEPLFLFVGDIFIFLLSLWLMLFIRYGELPTWYVFYTHLLPFSVLFIVWSAVFLIAGLYEKHTVIFRHKLPTILLNSEIANSFIAVLFFYFIPYFGITPKINLFIYLIVSFIFLLVWRLYGYNFLWPSRKQNAIIIGSGAELKELKDEINNNPKYGISLVSSVDLEKTEGIDFSEEVIKRIYSEGISLVIIDLNSEKAEPILPHLYNLIFSKVRFVDMHHLYEEIFDRVPLSLLRYNWFLENISTSPKVAFDFWKRGMDVVVSFVLGILTLIIMPFVALAIKLEDGGVIFSKQQRIGKNNQLINIVKFRTMTVANDGGNWGEVENKVTKVGRFLRKSRLDEFPQVWNVLKGDISLIGPRPEFSDAVKTYADQIPYYNIRHIIKPGLSGWAQIYGDHPHHDTDITKTKNKLSYDLYYIKNRSSMVDLKIALRTLQVLISQRGK